MGESDRLLTILTREVGLVRAVAMGSRKHNSSLGGRSGLFVVNELLIAKGRSLDKLTQAETIESYPGLSQDLRKLTAAQYLAELALYQALSDQPQDELFLLLNESLKQIEQAPAAMILPCLTQAMFQLLILAGVVPQVHACCVTRQVILPDLTDPNWRVGFSPVAGGVVTLEALAQISQEHSKPRSEGLAAVEARVQAGGAARPVASPDRDRIRPPAPQTTQFLTATELALLQQLEKIDLHASDPVLNGDDPVYVAEVWRSLESLLRHYAEYHLDRQIRSASLIDACFLPAHSP